jgi:hypothetical protein
MPAWLIFANITFHTMKKKTTTKAVPPRAPATKAVIAKPASKIAPAGKKKTVAPAPAPAPVVAVVIARIDIGFGNALYLRGEGPGLSWDRGVQLDCLGDDHWRITLPVADQPIPFKFLVNDLVWSSGPDNFVVEAGDELTLVPVF